jgi:methylenetetrahydrofolate dehydrogenase (NADP+)/methenyltetrahydrofolate cyclohydrolase
MDPTSTTTARLLPGKPVADAGFDQITTEVARLRARTLGFDFPHVHLPADATQDDLHRAIAGLDADPEVHALLIQHPVPPHLDYDAALAEVDPDKDADGMHPLDLGPARPRPPAGDAAGPEARHGRRRGHRRPHRRPGLAPLRPARRRADRGRRLLPDVDERCADVASAITPRVGGVGPTTVAMLFRNAVRAAGRAASWSEGA